MKLKFKNEQYQAEAAMAVVNCFKAQTKGFRKETVGREVIDNGFFGKKAEISEIFSNKKIELAEEDILKNVQEV